jgi:hypothetical protein
MSNRPQFTYAPIEFATEAELLEFANKIREAGGANPLDALMPSTPSDSKACLIAQALNFSCVVRIDRARGASPPWRHWKDAGVALGYGV